MAEYIFFRIIPDQQHGKICCHAADSNGTKADRGLGWSRVIKETNTSVLAQGEDDDDGEGWYIVYRKNQDGILGKMLSKGWTKNRQEAEKFMTP